MCFMNTLQSVQSLIAPGIAAVFLLGLCSKRITPTAGFAGLSIRFCAWYDPLSVTAI